MIQRDCSETDLRQMIHDAESLVGDPEPGRWRCITKFRGRTWIVILEPDASQNLIVVITAFQA
ncbi:MAG: hypothetical protein IPN34_10825 [Planctomycetes bacterium]|nr:hypothetical protein [Planctomycetota bacterium]